MGGTKNLRTGLVNVDKINLMVLTGLNRYRRLVQECLYWLLDSCFSLFANRVQYPFSEISDARWLKFVVGPPLNLEMDIRVEKGL